MRTRWTSLPPRPGHKQKRGQSLSLAELEELPQDASISILPRHGWWGEILVRTSLEQQGRVLSAVSEDLGQSQQSLGGC